MRRIISKLHAETKAKEAATAVAAPVAGERQAKEASTMNGFCYRCGPGPFSGSTEEHYASALHKTPWQLQPQHLDRRRLALDAVFALSSSSSSAGSAAAVARVGLPPGLVRLVMSYAFPLTDSEILADAEQDWLAKWDRAEEYRAWRLVHRAPVNECNIAELLKSIRLRGDVLIVVKSSTGSVFGACIGGDQLQSPSPYEAQVEASVRGACWLFSMGNPRYRWPFKSCPKKADASSCARVTMTPTHASVRFGVQDLSLCSDAQGGLLSLSYFGHAFQGPPGTRYQPCAQGCVSDQEESLVGDTSFRIEQLEAFEID